MRPHPTPRNALRAAATIVVLALASTAPAAAAGLLSYAQLVATAAAPVEQTFTPSAQQAGPIDVTLTDTAFPAALVALRAAVTRGATVIASASADAASPSTLTLTFNAVAGVSYTIRLVGRPAATTGSGTVLGVIAQSGQPANQYATFPATFQAPVAGTAGTAVDIEQTITVPATGDYQATLTDLALPAPMAYLGAALFQGANAGPTLAPGQNTLSGLAAGNYQLRILGVPSAAAGLISLRIQGSSSNALVYPATGASGVTAIGAVSGPVTIAAVPAGTVALSAFDLGLPGPLTTFGAALTDASGNLVARQCVMPCGATDPPSGIVAAGDLQLWRVATAGAGGGSDLTTVSEGGNTLFTRADSVPPPASSDGYSAFVFPVAVPAAGAYTVTVTDLQSPAALSSLQFSVFQGSSQAGSASPTAGQLQVMLAAQPAEVHVVAAVSGAGGSGLFGIQVAPAGNGTTPLLAKAQAVGAFTGSQTLSVSAAAAGAYAVTLSDAMWPKSFQQLNLFITQGAAVMGKVYGPGVVPLTLAAGDYQLTYSAVPDATEMAGLYGIDVTAIPAATASLAADSASISPGQSIHLSWTSTNASSCMASGGWSGPQATSGSGVAEGPLSATTTFMLTCTGAGGSSAPASVTVTVMTSSSGAGGGGALDAAGLSSLALLVLARRRHGRRRP